MGREGRGKGKNLIVSFLFLPSFCGAHTGLSCQGQRPKTAENTIYCVCEYRIYVKQIVGISVRYTTGVFKRGMTLRVAVANNNDS
jgi:hypothetical protein